MLEHLRGLRTGWKNEIPKRIIHSNDPDNLYKVRTDWFVAARADVWNLLKEGELTDDTERAAAEEFLQRFTSDEFVSRGFNTAEDIQTANNLIDIILGK